MTYPKIINTAEDLSSCELAIVFGQHRAELLDTREGMDSLGTIGFFSTEQAARRYARKHQGKIDWSTR